MKSRKQVVEFIDRQIKSDGEGLNKEGKYHYGKQELRKLLDFIYESKPNDGEELNIETYGDEYK